MREIPRWRRYLRFWGPDLKADIEDEIGFHLEMRERDFREAGLPSREAREEAIARFGDPESVRRWLYRHDLRRHKNERRIEIMGEWLQDVRYGLRRLFATPGFTLAVVAILGLGIGVTTAIVSVLDAALLRPLPYPDPERLVSVSDVQNGEVIDVASYAEYLDWRRDDGIFSDLGAYFSSSSTLTGAGEPETLQTVRMSANLPRLLGVTPRLGRAFAPGEEARSAPRVAMLSESLWRRRFGADPKVLGRAITLEGDPYTVIGVVPVDGFRSIVPTQLATAQRVDLWLPLRLNDEVAPRGVHFLDVVGRLRPGLAFALAEERLESLAARLRQSAVTEHGIRLDALEGRVIGDSRPMLVALAGAAGMVLLIACTNVANLLLARASARRREVAILAAIGAGRARIVRQLLVESLLLAVLGGASGVLLAHLGVFGLRTVGPASLPRLAGASVDGRMLAFALGLSLFTGVLFGLLPALRASRPDLAEVIKVGGRGTVGGPSRDRFRVALVVTEVALSFALLIGAGLLARSLVRLLAVEKGFETEHVVSAYLSLPFSRYPEAREQTAFFREVRERLLALPGVRSAALANNPPLTGGSNGGIGIAGRTFTAESPSFSWKRIVSPGYFETLGTPIVSGRAIDERDVAGAPQVAVVNEAFARRYFPGENPLGKRVDFSWDTTGYQEIVGVVRDAREQALHRPADPAIYVPLAQRAESALYVLVRASGPVAGMIPEMRQAVASIDRDRAIAQVETLDAVLDRTLTQRRLAMSLFGVFSGLALLLAAVGLYAVISYSVQQRRREIGIRLALGARAEQVAGAVVRRGVVLIAVGMVVGGLAALGLGRFLASLVYGVGTADPTTFLSVGGLLIGTAIVASLVPALRAARVDPVNVLRGE